MIKNILKSKKTTFLAAVIAVIAVIAAAIWLLANPVRRPGLDRQSISSDITYDTRSHYDAPYINTETDIPEGPSIPENETLRVDSPDGKYRAEAYGTNKNITAAGMYPYEGMRLIRNSDETIIWNSTGYYTVEFLWSGNSKYIAVNGEARIYGECFIVDADTGKVIELPYMNDITAQLDSSSQPAVNRPDPYFRVAEWVNDYTVRVNFRWIAREGEKTVSGAYEYDISDGKITSIISETGDQPG